ncbi:MAG: phosphoglucomutase [Proteobacteria bacterium]|nr:phosphoglucomutase [Pseudomonadota bacterium]MBU1739870.1 phosphoglucomutase [Pseudomonadota bacterium]
MSESAAITALFTEHIQSAPHPDNNYFALLRALVAGRSSFIPSSAEYASWQQAIEKVYGLIQDEIIHNLDRPVTPVKFGTSGWRGILGKDLFIRSVCQVTLAITDLYSDPEPEMAEALGVASLGEARARGCVVGHDNRFGGGIMAQSVVDILTGKGFKVYFAGESTTGVLSAALLELRAAFSINLTPSHNPLEYGGFKFNGADGGPAAKIITDRITANAVKRIESGIHETPPPDPTLCEEIDSLAIWIDFVRKNTPRHHLDYDQIIDTFLASPEMVIAVDSVHGASRKHIGRLFKNHECDRLILLRQENDPTFGGIAPEPSSANMAKVNEILAARPEKLKLGMIIDPDADRIRFSDGIKEIEMNKFGAAAYHYLHVHKSLAGPVAKSVATSNFANAVATGLHDEVFESRVGFKEFKPVVGKALVCFEESDGISVIGHTPEKDAYIGLLLAIDMTLGLKKNISAYISEIEAEFGAYYPDRDAFTVTSSGEELTGKLALLKKFTPGTTLTIGSTAKKIASVIDIDGTKLIFSDHSWLMIRPSGTEPKVRIYVEARSSAGRRELITAAGGLLKEAGVV